MDKIVDLDELFARNHREFFPYPVASRQGLRVLRLSKSEYTKHKLEIYTIMLEHGIRCGR